MSEQPGTGTTRVREVDGGHTVEVFDGVRWQPVAGGEGPAPQEVEQRFAEPIAHVRRAL